MADQKFSVDEILREYDPAGKRSGIRKVSQDVSSQSTLQSQKLIGAATSRKPISHEKTGYEVVPEPAVEEVQEENLIDIQSTINKIKENRMKQEQEVEIENPFLQEQFPTQEIQRGQISYVNAKNSVNRPVNDLGYDEAVRVFDGTGEGQADIHKPKIRQMESSSRAKERKKKEKRRSKGNAFKRGVEKTSFSEQSAEEKRSLKRKQHHQVLERDENLVPDNMTVIHEDLDSLAAILLLRCSSLILMTIFGFVLAFAERGTVEFLNLFTEPRVFAIIQVVMGIAAFIVAYPTITKGLKHLLKGHADCDSMAAISMIPAMITAILAVIFPNILVGGEIRLYMPLVLFGLMINTIGKFYMVRRGMRSCRVIEKSKEKRVLSYVKNEETASLLTKNYVKGYPVLISVRHTKSYSDFLKYTYSTDISDAMCKKYVPIYSLFSILIALIAVFIRMQMNFGANWFSFFFFIITMLLVSGNCVCCTLVSNLPLDHESKKAAVGGSTLLGYQSADDFYDANAILMESTDLFPAGSVKIVNMKMFGGLRMDESIINAASLAYHAESILKSAFAEMISEDSMLEQVEEFVCEDGAGLCGWIANKRVLLGTREMMEQHSIEGIPMKSIEAELLENGDDVLYLSISGVLRAVFAVKITANPKVKKQMRALQNEKISLIIRTVDSLVTVRSIADLFGFNDTSIRLLPSSMHNLFQRETAPLDCVPASVTVGNRGFGAAELILASKKVRRASIRGWILQLILGLLGLCIAVVHVFLGAFTDMTAFLILVYYLITTFLIWFSGRIGR